ncbi:MAG: hypothetical protein NT076_01845 [Candidatus Pacearchaeota archaeon]|nr:hypothetical protein [Candidatus Pacearchaeota archaeon]
MLGKRGIHLVGEEIVFYILNAVFFIVLLVFIFNSVNGKPVYEQAYAKQIAFLIDQAKPGTEIVLDVSDICNEYKIPLINIDSAKNTYSKPILDAFKIDDKSKKVIVKFGSMGSYGMPYFSNLKVEFDALVDGKELPVGLQEVQDAIKKKLIQDVLNKKLYCQQLKIKISEK